MMLSLVIPVYNVSEFLGRCLDSVVPLLNNGHEMIIVNDGSTDGSENICISFLRKHPEIKYVKQKNAGLSAARNAGLACASGDYVWFIDSDDYVNEKETANVFKVIQEKQPDIICFGRVEDYGDYKVKSPKNLENKVYSTGQEYFQESMMSGSFRTNAWDKIFKRSLIDKFNLRFCEGLLYEDMLFCLQAFMYAESVVTIKAYPYCYNLSNVSSITKSIRRKDLDVLTYIHLASDFIRDGDFKVKYDSQEFQLLIFNWVSSCLMNKYAHLSFSEPEADYIMNAVMQDDIFNFSVDYCIVHNVGFRQRFFARLLKSSPFWYKIILHNALKLKKYINR